MNRYGLILATLTLFAVACTSTPAAAPKPAPVAAVAVQPTVAPTAVVTPAGPDYGKLKWQLITPLSVLTVAVREKSPLAERRLAEFNAAAEQVEPVIAGDLSFNGNRLHSAIVNVRDAAARGDVKTLEQERADLIALR